MARYCVMVEGRVQGVGFRYYAYHCASYCRLTGWVRNLDDGRVELEIQGDKDMAGLFLAKIKEGSRFIRVDHMDIHEISEQKESSFCIRGGICEENDYETNIFDCA